MPEMCCTWLAENAGPKKVAKNCHLDTIAQLCRAISSFSYCFVADPLTFDQNPHSVHFYSSSPPSIILLNYDDTQPAVLCAHIDVYSQLELPVICEACVI